jgi:uncharacterized protein DUF4145
MEIQMKCPNCHNSFHPDFQKKEVGYCGRNESYGYYWNVYHHECPACHKPIIFLAYEKDFGTGRMGQDAKHWLIFPKGGSRLPAPPEVPVDIASDYNEATLILFDSPTASAALSRRCLQQLLSERGVTQSDNLSRAIDDALASGVPTHIAENLDAIRNVGNFAAHPQKSLHSGEILPVEPHEAEWNLEVLEMLFDFYYVQPALSKARREALNKKLEEVGKPPMKQGTIKNQ